MGDVQEHEMRTKNEFLVQMDDLNHDKLWDPVRSSHHLAVAYEGAHQKHCAGWASHAVTFMYNTSPGYRLEHQNINQLDTPVIGFTPVLNHLRLFSELPKGANGLPKTFRRTFVDAACLRRLQKKIEVPLPDKGPGRHFELEIEDTLCDLTPNDYTRLARGSDEFSGTSRPLHKMLRAALHEGYGSNSFYKGKLNTLGRVHRLTQSMIPIITSGIVRQREGAADMNWRDIPKDNLGELPVLREHFFEVLQQSRPTADQTI
jgi:SpoVK/Ycf46/Vps4 family AAA+-type ATPase